MHNNKDQNREETEMVIMQIALVASTDCRKYESCIIDSACTHHLSNRNNFENFSECEGTVHVRNNETIRSCITGNVPVMTVVNGEKFNVILYNVLYVPDTMYNLIAISRIRQNNCRIVVDIAGDDSRRGTLTIENEDSHRDGGT